MAAASSLRIVTFNAGLAVGVLPYATERLPHVVAAIAALDADLVFLQEIWLETHWKALRDAASARFPHAFRPPPTQPARHGACSEAEVAELVACARTHCAGLASDELGRCVLRRCGHLAASLSTACLNCIVSHPVGTLDQILAPCLGATSGASATSEASATNATSTRRAASGLGPTGLVAYGGSFGTALLSRVPLEDCDVLVYEATTLNARGAVYARITKAGFGDVHVFGTHLSPGIHEEQTRQIDDLLAWIDAKAQHTKAQHTKAEDAKAVVVGDLNTGPTVGEGRAHLRSALPALYRRFADAGFVNPYLESGAAKGTYGHGSLEGGGHPSSGWLIDHVLLRGFDASAHGERILDGPLVVRAAGRDVTTSYSDHCGVRLTVEPPGTRRAPSSRPNPR